MAPTPPVGAPIQVLHSAREAANRYRAQWLLSVAQGMLSPLELIENAAAEPGRPLRAIRLLELLRTQDGWGMARARGVLCSLRRILNVPDTIPDRDLKIAWLLDNRTAGQRVDAWIDVAGAAAAGGRRTPWPRFPYAPPPADRS